jgi:hypothetical protein
MPSSSTRSRGRSQVESVTTATPPIVAPRPSAVGSLRGSAHGRGSLPGGEVVEDELGDLVGGFEVQEVADVRRGRGRARPGAAACPAVALGPRHPDAAVVAAVEVQVRLRRGVTRETPRRGGARRGGTRGSRPAWRAARRGSRRRCAAARGPPRSARSRATTGATAARAPPHRWRPSAARSRGAGPRACTAIGGAGRRRTGPRPGTVRAGPRASPAAATGRVPRPPRGSPRSHPSRARSGPRPGRRRGRGAGR